MVTPQSFWNVLSYPFSDFTDNILTFLISDRMQNGKYLCWNKVTVRFWGCCNVVMLHYKKVHPFWLYSLQQQLASWNRRRRQLQRFNQTSPPREVKLQHKEHQRSLLNVCNFYEIWFYQICFNVHILVAKNGKQKNTINPRFVKSAKHLWTYTVYIQYMNVILGVEISQWCSLIKNIFFSVTSTWCK